MKRIWISAVGGLLLLWLAGAVVAQEEEVNAYVGDSEKSCKMCHKDQVAAWKGWAMASAWDRLSDEEKKKDECIACHVTGFGEEGGWVSEEKTPGLVGVQCEACHGPAGAHMKVKMTDKEGKLATQSMPEAANCTACHKKEGNPNFKEFKFDEAVKVLADHLKPKA